MHRLREQNKRLIRTAIPRSWDRVMKSVSRAQDFEAALHPTPQSVDTVKRWLLSLPLSSTMVILRALEELMWEKQRRAEVQREGVENGVGT